MRAEDRSCRPRRALSAPPRKHKNKQTIHCSLPTLHRGWSHLQSEAVTKGLRVGFQFPLKKDMYIFYFFIFNMLIQRIDASFEGLPLRRKETEKS